MSDFERGFQSGVRAVVDGGKERIEELQAKLDALLRIIEKQRFPSQIKKPMTQQGAQYYCLGHNDLRAELLNELQSSKPTPGGVNAGTALKKFIAVPDSGVGEPDGVVVQPLMSCEQHEKECGALIDERDNAVDWADKLAGAIGDYLGVDVGEHSNCSCPWQTAFDSIPVPRPGRSDQDIVDETNELASAIAHAHNYAHEDGFKFYLSDNPRAKWFWKVACDGQEALTQTNAEDALANLEEGTVVAEEAV